MPGVLNISAVQEALKSHYLPVLRYQLNDKASAFLAQLEKDTESVQGKEIVMAMRYGRQGGIGNRADDGALPTPNSRKTKQAKWETKNTFARFQISDKTIKASRNSVGAFANLLELEIKDAETDAKNDLSRQALGDGTGVLATISNVSGTTLTVDNIIFFAEGMLVDIYNSAGGTQRVSAVEVTAVNDSLSQITVSLATGVVNTDQIYVSGNKGLELTGLRAVFEAGILYGIDRSSANQWLKPTRINVNGEIAEVTIQSALDQAELKAGSNINFLMTSYGVRRAYQNLLTAQKQLVNTIELRGGWKSLSYNGTPLVADKYVLAGRLYGLDLADWKLYQMEDFNWLDADGAMLHRMTDKACWEATLVRYSDLGCAKPRGAVELYGITEH